MKNTLIRYKGGGYDGCFWEWNHAYYDGAGKFHDVYSSGRQGLPEEQQIREMLEQRHEDGDPELFNLGQPGDLERLNEINASSIVQIARWLEENLGYVLLIQCDDCQNSVDVLDIQLVDMQKEGGITYSHHGKVCDECYCAKICSGCGEYTPDELTGIDEHGCYCEWCYQEKMAEITPGCKFCGENEYTVLVYDPKYELTLTNGICEDCWAGARQDADGRVRAVVRGHLGEQHTLIIGVT